MSQSLFQFDQGIQFSVFVVAVWKVVFHCAGDELAEAH
jgi:hypothetical protein